MPIEHPWIDESAAPLYVLTMPPQRTDQEAAEVWAAIERFYASGTSPETFGWIIDIGRLSDSRPSSRAIMAEHIKRIAPYLRGRCLGLAVVVQSAVGRGVVQAISWLVPNKPAPVKTVANHAEGKAWLASLGLPASERSLAG